MDYSRNRNSDLERDSLPPLMLLGLFLKIGAFVLLLAIGLKLTFWAVDVVDQLLHRPADVAILQPLLEESGDAPRSFAIERDGDSITFRDHNAFSLFLLVGLLAILFGVIGRAIAALIGGAVRLLASIEFRQRTDQKPPV